MPPQDDATQDPVQSYAKQWAAESHFIGEAAEEQQTPVIHPWYQAYNPFTEERELEEMYGPEAEVQDYSADVKDEESDGGGYEQIDETSELYPERYSVELQEEELEGEDPQQVINGLIDKGLSENDITNEVFYQRNPRLRGQVLRAGTRQARQWRSIRDSEVRPAAKRLLGSWINDPVLLATFFSQYEGDSRVPPKATEQFLIRSPLLSMGKTLRDRVLWEWQSGKPPVTLDRLYELAYEVSGHSGSAMLLCHNVTKAFARGGAAITWDRVPTAPDTYSDGKKIWTPTVIHPDGKLTKTHSGKYKRELPSIYYLLFSAKELGTDDPGDWYHYYVAATMTAFGAAGELSPSALVRELEDREEEDRTIGPIVGGVIDKAYPLLVRDRVLDLESQMSNPDLVDVPSYRGWVLANVVSFLEGGHYGEKQKDVARESRFHLRGAVAGLRAVGTKPGRDWVWYVPRAKNLSEQDLAYGFQLQFKTAEVLDASGQPFSRPKKGVIREMYGPETEDEDYSTKLVDEEPEEEAYELIDEASELDLYQEPLAGEDEYPVTQQAGTGPLLQERFESLVEETKALLDEMASVLRRHNATPMSEAEIEAFLNQYQPVGTQLPQGFEYLLDDVRDTAKRIFKGAANLSELQTRQAGSLSVSLFQSTFNPVQGKIIEPEVEEFLDELDERNLEELDDEKVNNEVEEELAEEVLAELFADEEEILKERLTGTIEIPNIEYEGEKVRWELPPVEYGPIILSAALEVKLTGKARFGAPTTKIGFSKGQEKANFEAAAKGVLGTKIEVQGEVKPGKLSKLGIKIGKGRFQCKFEADTNLLNVFTFVVENPVYETTGRTKFGGWIFEGEIKASLAIHVTANLKWSGWTAIAKTVKDFARAAARTGRVVLSVIRGLFVGGQVTTYTTLGALAIGAFAGLAAAGGILFALYMIGVAHREARAFHISHSFNRGFLTMYRDVLSEEPAFYANVPVSVAKFHYLRGLDWKKILKEAGRVYIEDENKKALTLVYSAGMAAMLQAWFQYQEIFGDAAILSLKKFYRERYSQLASYSWDKNLWNELLPILDAQVKENAAFNGIPPFVIRR